MTPLSQLGSHRTLLIIKPGLVARIDLWGVSSPKQGAFLSEAKDTIGAAPQSLTELLTRAVRLSPKRIGKVSIVSSEFWTDVVTLPSDVVALTSSEELDRAIAFEAELESGISALASRVAYAAIESEPSITGSSRDFLVTQILDSQWSELESAIRSMGGKLECISHPAAVLAAQKSFKLSEVHRQKALWSEPAQSSPSMLEELLLAWQNVTASPAGTRACCLNSGRQRSLHQQIALSCLLAFAACTGCWFWHRHEDAKLTNLISTNGRLDQRQQTHNDTLSAIQKLQGQLAKLKKELAEAESGRRSAEKLVHTAVTFHSLQNQRWGRLLEALASTAQDCWLHRIESDAKQTSLRGVATDSSQAHAFAARLESALNGLGWALHPAATRQLPGGLCEFTIVLQQIHSGVGGLGQNPEISQLFTPHDSSVMLAKIVAEATP